MDILTQGITGALTAQTAARPEQIRYATAIGFFAGLLADLDVLIRSSQDPLLTLEYHRHFTHSVFFIPFGALLAALLVWPIARKRLGFTQIYVFSLLGYLLSGFIDACTSYGTHLFWPLMPDKVAFNIIAIVDPLFTLIMLVALVWAWKQRKFLPARFGMLAAGGYLLLGWYQMHQATLAGQQLAQQRGHRMERQLVKPTVGNLLLWRSLYLTDNRIYVDAIRLRGFEPALIYPGGSQPLFEISQLQPSPPEDSPLYRDLQRFIAFSDGYVAMSDQRGGLVGDIRYAMLPDSIQPLWGVEFDPQAPQQHARYRIMRDTSEQTRRAFVDMLMARSID